MNEGLMFIVLVSLSVGFFGEDYIHQPIPIIGFTFRSFFVWLTVVVVTLNSIKSGMRIGLGFWVQNSIPIFITLGTHLLFAFFSNLPAVLYQEKFLVYLTGFLTTRIIVISSD